MKHGLLGFIISSLSPKTPYLLVYMLQQVEYDPRAFMSWLHRYQNFSTVMKRKKLEVTKKAFVLLVISYLTYLAMLGLAFIALSAERWLNAFLAVMFCSLMSAYVLYVVVLFAWPLLAFKRRKITKQAARIFANHKAVKIAVLGSYGKTTMKELLATVLSESKVVAATPGNNNVLISHARWAVNKLTGGEEVLVIEFGEYRPGDIANMALAVQPDIAIITGVAPNHLENYQNYDELKRDLASIQLFVTPKNVYVAEPTAQALKLADKTYTSYDDTKVIGWQISSIKTSLDGTSFVMKKAKQRMLLKTSLLGEYMVGPVALTASIADSLGLTKTQIEAGIAKTKPFAHRMQPINTNGAFIIDDTYNGNIEGMRSGLKFLKSVKAKRKIYVTPGLVEQGSETEAMHVLLGKLIAEAHPDIVILMQNSVCSLIERSLEAHGFKGEVRIEAEPLQFYTNLHYQLAAGDIVLMQNDWADNYN